MLPPSRRISGREGDTRQSRTRVRITEGDFFSSRQNPGSMYVGTQRHLLSRRYKVRITQHSKRLRWSRYESFVASSKAVFEENKNGKMVPTTTERGRHCLWHTKTKRVTFSVKVPEVDSKHFPNLLSYDTPYDGIDKPLPPKRTAIPLLMQKITVTNPTKSHEKRFCESVIATDVPNQIVRHNAP